MKLTQILSLVLLVSLISCKPNTSSSTTSENADAKSVFERMDVHTFQSQLAKVENPQLVDVRTPEEFENGSIEGAVNINFHDDDFLEQISKKDKNQPIFIYCQAGGRSLKAAQQLQGLGFNEIYELETGYSGWEQ